MSLIVEDPGILSLLVDKGRQGYQGLGITVGGPADEYAYKCANALCANSLDAICIESIGTGVCIAATQACEVSVTGAATRILLNKQAHEGWQNFYLQAGDRLVIDESANGVRSYIGVAGGLEVKKIFGSATTVMRDGLGGIDGQGAPLHFADKLVSNGEKPFQSRTISESYIPDNRSHNVLSVVAGYQISEFSQAIIDSFQSIQYCVSPQSDRMAVRLTGESIKIPSFSMLSEGLCRGAIQLPPQGIPIVMLSDRQTIGGYPKIGTLLSCDCDALAQIHAGSEIRFSLINIFTAQNILQLKQQKFLRMMEQL